MGLWVAIEGMEAAGKTTLIQGLKELAADINPLMLREPGGSPLGEDLRELLLKPGMVIDQEAELLMMFASRAQLVKTVILPAVNEGRLVLLDRYIESSMAYQGGGRGLGVSKVVKLFKLMIARVPDLTIQLHPKNPQVVLGRLQARKYKDRFERERPEFFDKVIRVYDDLAHGKDELADWFGVTVRDLDSWLASFNLPARKVINAELEPQEVLEQARQAINQAARLRGTGIRL